MSSFLGHSLAAYTLSTLDRRKRSSAKRETLWAGWLIVLASAPDIDYVMPALATPAHRGLRITHSVAFALILPLASVGVICAAKSLRGRKTLLGACAVLAGLSHLVLDFLVGVTPLPLFWPLSAATFSSPLGILPSAGRIQMWNYYLYRNVLIELGVLLPVCHVAGAWYRGEITARDKIKVLALLLIAGCFAAWSVSLRR